MRSIRYFAVSIAVFSAFAIMTDAIAQSGKRVNRSKQERKQSPIVPIADPPTEPQPQPPQPQPEDTTRPDDSINSDAYLVNMPVIASEGSDTYVYDLQKEDFTLTEDGIKQQIALLGAVREPFHIVLMLDTSGSTREQFGKIQEATKAFVAQLQTEDQVKIISFDNNVRDWGEFTNDRAQLRSFVDMMSPGQGTKLYDAMQLALNSLQAIKGRKAIVLFTDGIDWHSDSAKYDNNIRQVEESSVIVYPIRYDTRHETEALIIEKQAKGETVDLEKIFGSGAGIRTETTPTTASAGKSPTPKGGGLSDIKRLPFPPPIVGGSRSPERYPGGRVPDPRNPQDRIPDNRNPKDKRNPNDHPPDAPDSRQRQDESISVLLDGVYSTAIRYLAEMGAKSGGRLLPADTLRSLPDAFANIAAEMRNQYSLGYYPTNHTRNGQYRKVQVKVSRRDVMIRTRPGYRMTETDPSPH